MSLHTLTVAELAAGLRARRFSSLDLTLHFLGRIERLAPQLNAFVTVTADRALADARAADEQLARGEGGPLTGVPVAHKDIFCTDGILTTCASKMLSNFVAPYDATVVERWRAGTVARQDPTWMSSPWQGSSNETSLRPGATLGSCVGPGGSRVLLRRCRPVSPRPRAGPIREARSASPRLSPT
jgi:aspartyl-tRNA(Asn)/glutamyl-tRNA(Gln) amidotransferase subunit A